MSQSWKNLLSSSLGGHQTKLAISIISSWNCSPDFELTSKKYGNYIVCVTSSCPTLCDPMDWSPPGSSVHGILQARLLEWVAIPFCRGSSWPRDRTWDSCTAGRFFTHWATREVQKWYWPLWTTFHQTSSWSTKSGGVWGTKIIPRSTISYFYFNSLNKCILTHKWATSH